jgi:hypothetical protein
VKSLRYNAHVSCLLHAASNSKFFFWLGWGWRALVDFDGKFVGMNFYDAKEGTPFLPQTSILEALAHFERKRYCFFHGSVSTWHVKCVHVVGRNFVDQFSLKILFHIHILVFLVY